MAAQNFLAFDLGAESGRAVLGTLDSRKLTLAEKHRFANPTGRINGHLHWNLMAQWEELKIGLRKAAQGATLDALGVDTWGVDFGLIGRSGVLLGNPYMYRDSRTDGMMDRAFEKVPRSEMYERTGIQFMQLNSIFQVLSMVLSRHPALDVAQSLLFMPDLFNYLFSGVAKNEFSIATTSQMYDPQAKRWAMEMLQKLGIPTNILGEIVPSGTILGAIRDDVAEECGLKPIPVVAPGCHDTASAVAGVPASPEKSWCYISSGTWSLMGVELPEPLINEKTLKYNYTNEGGVGGTIRFLKNIMGLWLVQECRRQFEADGHKYDYAELTKLAAAAKPHVAFIDPEHGPFGSPGQMPQKIDAYLKQTNQPSISSPGEYVRACIESLAHIYRKTLDGLEDILGQKIEVIHIVGGGTQNELLNQMTADACARPVITGPAEATAIGNILVQAMAVGAVKDVAELRLIVRESFPVKRYEPRDTAAWEKPHASFRQATQK